MENFFSQIKRPLGMGFFLKLYGKIRFSLFVLIPDNEPVTIIIDVKACKREDKMVELRGKAWQRC